MQLFQISWFVTLIVPTSNAIFRLPCLPLKGGGGWGHTAVVKLGTVSNFLYKIVLRFLEFNMLIVIKMWMMLAKFLRSMNEITHLKNSLLNLVDMFRVPRILWVSGWIQVTKTKFATLFKGFFLFSIAFLYLVIVTCKHPENYDRCGVSETCLWNSRECVFSLNM